MLARLLPLLFLIGSPALRAQDDAAILAALGDVRGWRSEEVGDGVWLRQLWLPHLFDGPQHLTVLEVAPASGARFDVIAPGARRRTSAIGAEAGSLAAINGGFFAIESTGAPTGLLRIDGLLQVAAKPGQGSLGIVADGRLVLTARPAGDWPEVEDALGAGPMLLHEGAVVDHGARQRRLRHPRSAIGTRADGTVLWLTVDGRTPSAAGTTFEQTGQLLLALGCRDGLNLDGGGSTTLWVAGRGICNRPCDNKRFDRRGERAVATALVLQQRAVVVLDDDEAELIGAGWQPDLLASDSHGADAACLRGPGSAGFVVALPRAGRWRVQAWAGSAAVGSSCRAELPGAAATTPVVSTLAQVGWNELGSCEVAVAGGAALRLHPVDGAHLWVDGVRFVQQP
jgi:Phosphodiester glycosidase